MKVGITLPQFRDDPSLAVAVARHAEDAGIDGVFAFDHLWPIGRPDRPALHGTTLVAALAVETAEVAVGTLVARVSLLPDAVLAHTFATLQRMAGARLVAGVGIGDGLSKAENLAYGVAFPPAAERRASLTEVCRRLRGLGIESWVGGTAPATRALAHAEADAVNLWGVGVDAVADEVARSAGTVTWGGQVDLGAGDDVGALVASLARAGAAWAVVAPLGVAWDRAVEAVAAARP